MDGSNKNHNGSGNGHDPDEDNVIHMPTLAERDKMRREAEKQWRKEYRQSNQSEPFINLPTVTKILVGVIIALHIITAVLLDPPAQYWVMEHFGFIAAYYTGDFPGWPAFAGPITYMFIHGSWLHIGMNSVMLVAFGSGVEKWMGGKRMFTLFFLCGLAAALIQFILSPFSTNPMVGASGGISGLFAAVLLMFQMQGRMGTGKHGILPFIALWIGISVIFGLLGGPDGSTIAWAAHIGGFVAGLLLLKPVLRMK